MSVTSQIRRLFDTYDGFNPPATPEALERLGQALPGLPDDVVELYRAFDGSAEGPRRGEHRLFSRLMPVAEALEETRKLNELTEKKARAGALAWLWSDDSSNWVGVYTDGPLRGWVVLFDHEEPSLVPVWRSVESFLVRWLDSAVGTAVEKNKAYDIVMVPAELPLIRESPEHTAGDAALARTFAELYEREDAEKKKGRRRFYARCAMTLTPPSETASIARFLADPDMWTPETAASIMSERGFEGAVAELESVVRGGRANGAGTAAFCLASLKGAAARDAVERLARDPDEKLREAIERAVENVQWRKDHPEDYPER
jgi:hypothetical protein